MSCKKMGSLRIYFLDFDGVQYHETNGPLTAEHQFQLVHKLKIEANEFLFILHT